MGFFDFAIPVFHSYGHKIDCQVSSTYRRLVLFTAYCCVFLY